MATSSATALPFRNILFACDEAFQRKPHETSVFLNLENCFVLRVHFVGAILIPV